MIKSSSLATLIAVLRLSCSSRAGFVAKTGLGGISRATADEMLRIASFALAVAFSATAHAPDLFNLAENEKTDANRRDARENIEEYAIADNDNVNVLGMQPSRLSAQENARHRPQTTPESDAKEQRPRISTRRHKRAYNTSSRNHSDFCNTALSRQVKAMVSEAESSYENRHVRKSKHVTNQQTCAETEHLMTKGEEQARFTDPALKSIKTESSSSPTKNSLKNTTSKPNESTGTTSKNNPFQMLLRDHQKTSKSIKDTPRFQRLRQALRTVRESDDCMPAVTPRDSLASLSSHPSPSMVKRVEQVRCTGLTWKRIKNESSSAPMKNLSPKTSQPNGSTSTTSKDNPFQMLLHDHQKTPKSIEDTPQLQRLRRAPQTIQESDDCVPAMTPCDSLASISSDVTLRTGSRTGFSGRGARKEALDVVAAAQFRMSHYGVVSLGR